MKNRILFCGISVVIVLLAGCGNQTNTIETNEPQIFSEDNRQQEIYDEALNLAYDGNFSSAVSKLNELDETYKDSDELIKLFQKDVSSPFVGTWYCSRSNSCNDMDITLTIKPVYRSGEMQLYFERDMVSPSGSGGSNITGTINIPSSSSTTVSRLNSAKWTISGNTLTELFTGDNNKQNKYTKR